MKANTKSSNSSVILISSTLLLTILFSYLLYSSYYNKNEIHSEDNLGIISYKNESVQRRYGNRVIWEDISQDMPVYSGDAIKTEKLSEAVIKLKDGTSITLEPESMIILSFGEESIDIGYNYGIISAKRNSGTEKFKTLKIQADRITLNIEKSNIQLKKSRDETLNLSVHEGSAEITGTDNNTVKISSLEKAVITKKSDDIKITPVSFNLLEPEDNRYISTAEDSLDIVFKWKKSNNTGTVRFELANDPLLAENIISRETEKDKISINIKPGTYYWRLLKTENTSGKKIYSETFKFTFLKEYPIKLVYPENGQAFKYYSVLPPVSFQWEKDSIGSSYRVIASRDVSFTNPIVIGETQGETLTEFNLDEGEWYWKVLVKTPFRNTYVDTGTAAKRFSIIKRKMLSKPEPVFPEQDKKIQVEWIKKNNLYFSWEKPPELISSEFFLSDDKNFNNILINKITNGSFVSLDISLPPGFYFWKIISSTADKELSLASTVRNFRVLKELKISLLYPPDNTELKKNLNIDTYPVNFKWTSNNETVYYFELSPSIDFSGSKTEKILKKNVLTVDDIKHGIFYWRVSAIDEFRNTLYKSETRMVRIIPSLDRPVLIEPKNRAVINMRKKKSLKMSWAEIKGAEYYIVRLYYNGSREKSKVHEVETKYNSVYIMDLSKLDRGRFNWSVTGVMKDQTGEPQEIKSPEAEGNFEITLGKKLEKTRIISPDIQYSK